MPDTKNLPISLGAEVMDLRSESTITTLLDQHDSLITFQTSSLYPQVSIAIMSGTFKSPFLQ